MPISMKTFINKFSLNYPLSNLNRPRYALVLLVDNDGKYILGSKPNFYPPNIYRLIGGGIKKMENPVQGCLREIKEEIGIIANNKEVELLAKITTIGIFQNEKFKNYTFLFKMSVNNKRKLIPGGDITKLKVLNHSDFLELIENYQKFSSQDWYFGSNNYKHSWQDYGKMFAFIHQVAFSLDNIYNY